LAQALKIYLKIENKMKNYLTVLMIALLSSMQISAQQSESNFTFFTENGERFILILNGQRMNIEPATNVRTTGLTPGGYKVKAIFEDEAIGQATSTIMLDPAMERTFNIRPKKKTMVGNTLKKMTNQVARDLNISARDTTTNPDKETYVIRWVSDMSLLAPVQENAPVQQTQMTVTQQQSGQTRGGGTVVQSGSTTTSTTTVVTEGAMPTGSGSVNVQVNDEEENVQMNINIAMPVVTMTEQTTVTSSSSGSSNATNAPAQASHYVMPGYDGAIGCSWPMQSKDYSNAQNSIKKASFEEDKLKIAKQVAKSNCFTTEQVKGILKLLTFEESKLDFAKFAYSRTYDIGNYFSVNDVFTFSASKDELNEFLDANAR